MPALEPITSSPARLKARARIARAVQVAGQQPGHPAAAEAVADARRAYKFVTLQDHISHVVDAAPPLTPAQRDRLALLLRGGGVSDDAA